MWKDRPIGYVRQRRGARAELVVKADRKGLVIEMLDRCRVKKGAALVTLAAVAGALTAAPLSADEGRDEGRGAKVVLRDSAGVVVGTVKLKQRRDEVLVRASVSRLTPGFHGFHVHAVGQCVPPFTSAGGHYNPGGTGHGQHAGDMPSLLVNADGSAELEFTTDRFSLAELRDSDGSTVIVHASPDNFAHIPTRYHSHTENTFGPDSATVATGDAGVRVACGVVAREDD
jgi:Cu-Zn family superoxide dismutase